MGVVRRRSAAGQGGTGLIRRIWGVVARPRATFAALVQAPALLVTWLAILIIWIGCGGWLLSTEVGQQALVDERVRVVEAFGGTVTDAEYAALQTKPPWWIYFTSGGRVLLLPVTTVAVAALLLLAARLAGTRATMTQALALVVHASIVLVIGQLVATPIHYVRESLTTPFNLAAVLPLLDEGTLAARFFGTIDLFAVWWMGLLCLGVAALTGQRAGQYAWRVGLLLLVFAAVTATIIVAMGGA